MVLPLIEASHSCRDDAFVHPQFFKIYLQFITVRTGLEHFNDTLAQWYRAGSR